MAETKTCPKCGAVLPENAPAGICPTCLMQAGLASEQDGGSSPEMKPTMLTSGFVPPEPEDLAKHFPQLEILELSGKGGMGAVYKARQPGLDRLVAVKILPPEVGADPAFAERFTREARALAKLSHQNIVSIFDSGVAGGLYYFMMEYVDGTNLRHVIETGSIKPEEALAIVPQICEALQFAHDAGIVHRDIKPENILVDKQGRVKIADFGLAKLLGKAPTEGTLTGTHQAMGTLHYMAPEQMQGAGSVDHRADIYSLGVVFYELLTGQLPIGKFDPPSRRVQVDVRLDEVVLRSLESEPDRRYQRASEIKSHVESISRSEGTSQAENAAERVAHRKPGFSRKAILGACWAAFFFMALCSSMVTTSPLTQQNSPAEIQTSEPPEAQTGDTSHRREVRLFASTWWQWVLIASVVPLALTAPFGTTILGLVAISNIRHSAGRLTGLPLALGDALIFPLLVLDALIVCVFWVLSFVIGPILFIGYEYLLGHETASDTWFWLYTGITLLLSLPVCAYVDYLIGRAAWHKVSDQMKLDPIYVELKPEMTDGD